MKSSGKDLLGIGYDMTDVNYLYGQDMTAERAIIPAVRGGAKVAELVPVTKGMSAAVNTANNLSKQTIKQVEETFARGTHIKLRKEQYTYVGEGQFIGPNGGRIINTGQVDSITGNYVYQRINKNGQFSDKFFMISENGKQIGVNKPEALHTPKEPIQEINTSYNRYLRKDTLDNIYANYEKLPNGDYRNIIDGDIIKGPIDVGHIFGWEHRRLSAAAKELNWSQKQFNNYVNSKPEIFRLENRSRNRSHIDEMPSKDKIQDILKDMQNFEKRGK